MGAWSIGPNPNALREGLRSVIVNFAGNALRRCSLEGDSAPSPCAIYNELRNYLNGRIAAAELNLVNNDFKTGRLVNAQMDLHEIEDIRNNGDVEVAIKLDQVYERRSLSPSCRIPSFNVIDQCLCLGILCTKAP